MYPLSYLTALYCLGVVGSQDKDDRMPRYVDDGMSESCLTSICNCDEAHRLNSTREAIAAQ